MAIAFEPLASNVPKTYARSGLGRSGDMRAGYPILAGVQVATYALSGIARSNAFRSSYHSPKVFIAIDGIHYGSGRTSAAEKVLIDSLSVTETVDETPHRATFTTMGFAPTVGQPVIITLGSKNNEAPTFAGQILTVEQGYAGGVPEHAQYRVDCIDPTWGLDKRLVTGRYSGSVTTIAKILIAAYAPGYATTFIAPGLEAVDEITFTEESLTDALTRLSKRIGGYWYCDYVKTIHLWSGAEDVDWAGLTNPIDLNAVHSSLRDFQSTRDLSQVVTRVRSEGGGANAIAAIAPGETIIPVGTGEWYNAAGGLVRSGPQQIRYSACMLGGRGTLVGPGASPVVAPTVALVSGLGIDPGVHLYAVTFVTASGESLAGPTVPITTGPLTPPPAPTVGQPTIGTGPNPGTHLWAITFITAAGETTPGATVTAATTMTPPPAIAPTIGSSTIGSGPDPGTHDYAVTFVTSIGETTSSVISAPAFTGLTPAPTTAPKSNLASGGSVDAGPHYYQVTFVTSIGETTPGPYGEPITTGGPAAAAPGTAPTPTATAGGQVTIGAHTYATTFITAAGETGPGPVSASVTPQGPIAPPGAPNAAQYNHASATQLGPGYYYYKVSFVTADGETTCSAAWSVYIAAVGNPDLTILATPTTGGSVPAGHYGYGITFVTAAGETAMGGNVQNYAVVDGTSTNAVRLELTTSPDPRVIGRRIYRFDYRFTAPYQAVLVGALNDNATTTFLDTAASGTTYPPSNSTYYAQVQLSAIATGPAGTTARKIYRTMPDGTIYYHLATINNNATTTYTDATTNISMNPTEPTANTTQRQTIMLSSIPTGPSGTQARRIYRTAAGGGTHLFLVELSGNSTTSYADMAPDSALGWAIPTSGATLNTVTLSSIPKGDANVTSRRIYRTRVGGGPFYLLTTLADNATTSYTDMAADASLGAAPPTASSAHLQRITLEQVPLGDANVTSRKIYRRSGGLGLKYAGMIADNTTRAWTDTTPNASLGAAPPAASTAHLQRFPLQVPTGPPTVTGRKVYRTTAGGATLLLAATIADNTTTVWTDTIADASLGAAAPGTNTAREERVAVSGIPAGAAIVTARKLYRTAAGQSTLKLLTTIADNITTTYSDVAADSALGATAPTVDTSGLPQPEGVITPGSTELIVAGTGWASPTGGWAIIGNGAQVIRYTGTTANALTGIPATGDSAITASIAYNSTVTAAPELTGIPATGEGAIRYAILRGDQVNLVVIVDDLEAQAALAALIGGDGIQETPLSDNRISEEEARARGTALLALRGKVEIAISYSVRDINSHAGRTVKVNLGPPTDVLGEFTIQQVTITPTTPAATVMPTYRVEASTTRFSFENLLALARKAKG
jgi:hypothetical protein